MAEYLHGAAEPLQIRNRLFKYLVEEEGFVAIALESGIVEGELLYDYVLGDDISLDDALSDGLSAQFDTLPQNAELLRWMRAYNMGRPEEEKIRIYGFDVPGSASNRLDRHGPEVALYRVLQYLETVDAGAAQSFRGRVGHVLPLLNADYTKIEKSDRDALTVAIADVISYLEINQLEYERLAGHTAYERAHRAAIGARQVDAGLRPTEDSSHVRERAMADNLQWVLDHVGGDGRVFVFASMTHIAESPILYVEQSIEYLSFGMHANRRFSEDYLSIAMYMGQGAIGNCGPYPETQLTEAPQSTVNGLMRRLDVPLFLLDLRDAPGPVDAWLREVREHSSGFGTMAYRTAEATDLAFFVESYSPACQ